MEKNKKILIGKEDKKKGAILQKKAPSAASRLSALPSPDAALVLLGEEHSGRDEMNLAGHPFALLQALGRRSETSIEYEWPRTLPDGRLVTAKWHVTTPEAYGLPGPNEELLYLVLLQLTREAAETADTPREWPTKVFFSRFDLIERLGWPDNAQHYEALGMGFRRLNAVNINARHAFWDARYKAPYAEIGFGMISSYAIADEPRGRKGQTHIPLSWFEWNTTLHTSFHAGNVRSLALDFAISLEHPTTRRLFRLLELLRHAQKPPRPQIQIGLEKLRDRLGMAAYPYPSKIKEKLVGAHEELTKRGYLAGVEYEKGRDGQMLALYAFGTGKTDTEAQRALEARQKPANGAETPLSEESAPHDVDAPRHELLWAHTMCEKYEALPDEVRERLRGEAREGCGQWLWDRLENPDSPALWEMVERETN